MTLSMRAQDFYAPHFVVELVNQGARLSPDSITGIEIDEDLETPAMFKLSLSESLDAKTQQFRWLDSPLISPGNEVVISFGYASSSSQGMMRGRIVSLTPGFLSGGMPTLSVQGYDLSHDLQKTEGELSYANASYSQVATTIATDNGLAPSGVEATPIVYPKVDREKNENDHAFLKRLAEKIGYEFFVRDKVLHFRSPTDTANGEVTFALGQNIISFNPRLSAAALTNEVEVTAWNEKAKETISETATIQDVKSAVGIPNFDRIVEQSQAKKVKVRLEGKAVGSREEAKAIALAELRRRNKGFIEGSLECIGSKDLRPGITINIEKVGKLFSGVYYITKARHQLGESGFRTTLDVRRSVL